MSKSRTILLLPVLVTCTLLFGFPKAEESVVLVRMPDEAPLSHPPREADIARFVATHEPFLYLSGQDLRGNPVLARQVLGQVQIFEELKRFQLQRGIAAKVQFIDWNDAFRYFADYVSDPKNPPLVAQLGDTWAAYFRSRGVLSYERRFTWDVRVLWYWRDLVDRAQITDGEGFLSVCREIQQMSPPGLVAPLAVPTAPTWDLLHDLSIWLYNAGVRDLVSTDKKLGLLQWKEAVFAGPEAERAVQFLSRLARLGMVAFPEQEGREVAEDFLAKKYAMVILGPSSIVRRAELMLGSNWESKIGTTLPPAIGATVPTTMKGGSLLVVLDPSRGKDLSGGARAELLVDFLTSEESQHRYIRVFGGDLPGNPEVLSVSPHFGLFSEALEKGTTYPEMPEWAPVVENLVTRDNLYAFWKRLAALTATRMAGTESEWGTREKLILGALQSAQVEINRELSHGKLSSLWPWLVTTIVILGLTTFVLVWRQRVERECSHRKLAESEARYRDLYDHAPDMFCSIDAGSGRIVHCNQTLVTKTGYHKEEIIGRHIFEMYHPDCFEELRKAFQTFEETGEVRDVELELRTKEGKKLAVGVNVSAIRDEQGQVIQGRSVWRDITKRKRAEEIAERQRQELAHVARLATMGELAASLAHELNQPLTAVVSNAQAAQRLLSREVPDSNEGLCALADIVREGQRAGDVIRALRALFRKGDFDPKDLDINEVIQEVISLLRAQTVLRNVSMRLELDPDLPHVLGDRIQLQQVVLNFILNALEAMEHSESDGRKLLVRSSKTDDRTVDVAVQDSGIGLDENTQDRIFDAFFTTKPKGFGMGLSINRTIIEAHGGKLWVTQNPDQGATFHFTLPVAP